MLVFKYVKDCEHVGKLSLFLIFLYYGCSSLSFLVSSLVG